MQPANENSEKQCSPAKPTGQYQPLLIPSGLDLRTCPDNVLDGQRLWGGGDDTVDEQTTTKCTMNDCDGEEHTNQDSYQMENAPTFSDSQNNSDLETNPLLQVVLRFYYLESV